MNPLKKEDTDFKKKERKKTFMRGSTRKINKKRRKIYTPMEFFFTSHEWLQREGDFRAAFHSRDSRHCHSTLNSVFFSLQSFTRPAFFSYSESKEGTLDSTFNIGGNAFLPSSWSNLCAQVPYLVWNSINIECFWFLIFLMCVKMSMKGIEW